MTIIYELENLGCDNMENIVDSLKKGVYRCCNSPPAQKVKYENNETWLVCSDCILSSSWNRYIKKKTTFKMDIR